MRSIWPGYSQEKIYDFRSTRRGFTMAEILIVMAIIAIAALIMIPMIGSAASMQLHSAANMIAADLEYAKSMAISRSQTFSVVFNTTEDSYRIENQNGDTIGHPVKKGFDYVIDLQDAGLDKVDISSVNFDTTGTIKFDYVGSPYNGNDNALNNGLITLQAAGVTTTVAVEPVTGFISVTE
ncbi:MAG: GspH/FimT family protein [Planctomycetota bacterium]|jgi:prepilin-type N-terminal cleavage/methylation domain-containing protein